VWGWIISGVVFVLMGALPLLVLRDRDFLRHAFWGDPKPAQGPTTPLMPASPPMLRPDRRTSTTLTGELRDLAQLHSQGALTDEEFAAAKKRLLEDR
jgi:hypothetical protein